LVGKGSVRFLLLLRQFRKSDRVPGILTKMHYNKG
jgi:hypothetical protein